MKCLLIFFTLLILHVTGMSQDKLSFDGRVNIGNSYYKLNEKNQTTYNGLLTINAKYKNINVPININFIEKTKSIGNPFNRIGISPTIKNVGKIYLGYNNVSLNSNLGINTSFFGAGIDVNYKKIRLFAAKGKMFNLTIPQNIDRGFFGSFIPDYKRSYKALKIGFGGQKNYVDLFYFNVGDVVINDSTSTEIINKFNAKENGAIGIETRNTIKKLTLDMSGTISAYNESGIGTEAQLEKYANLVNKIITPKESTAVGYRLLSKLSYNYKNQLFSVNFEKISPSYYSLQSYFNEHDLNRYYLTIPLKLIKNKLTTNLSGGIENRKLSNQSLNRNKRFYYNLQANYIHNKTLIFNANVNSAQASFANNELSNGGEFVSNNLSIFLMGTKKIDKAKHKHKISLAYTYGHFNNVNTFTTLDIQQFTNNFKAKYSLLIKKWDLKPNIDLTYFTNKQNNDKSNYILNSGVTKNFGKKLSLQYGLRILFATVNHKNNGTQISNALRANYKISKLLTFSSSFMYDRRQSSVDRLDFDNFRFTNSLTQNF